MSWLWLRRTKADLYVLVASNTGRTAQAVLDEVKGDLQVICVTHHVGFKEPGHDEMEPEKRQELQEQGAKVLTTTHVLAGVDRAVRNQFGGLYPPEIIASALRMLGQGVKVCVEIAIMALDGGLIPYGIQVIAIGGTSRAPIRQRSFARPIPTVFLTLGS